MKSFPLFAFFFSLTFAFLPSCLLPLSGQTQVNERAEWFVDARFGMFIHWGVYSGAEGIWKGEKLRYDNDYAEWIFYRNRIDKDEYLTLLDKFDWNSIDPEKWVLLAKQAGMKYVTLTAKHHDGFALWDSKVSDYDVSEYTDPKRDIVRELAEACKKHGLEMGLYYSHWVDWEHQYGWDHTREIYGIEPEQYDQYWQEKVMPQMRELLTNYGDIGMIWFDMWIHHSNTIVTESQLLQLKGMIRELQPDCLINSRLGLSLEEDPDVDFKTLGDNQFGSMKLDYPWQSPATVAHSWGYHALENQWKSSTTILKNLINNVSLNGNLMLNIGPRASGDVPYEIQDRMVNIGWWLERNGESIYGAGGFDLNKDQHDWCSITSKMKSDSLVLYLHIFNWPLDNEVKLTGIKSPPSKIYLLVDKNKRALPFTFDQLVTKVELPGKQPDPLITVIALEYDHYPDVEIGLVAESMSDGYSLTPANCLNPEQRSDLIRPEKFGSVPLHIRVEEKEILKWRIYIDDPGIFNIDASYSFQGKKGRGKIKITALMQTQGSKTKGRLLKASLNNTGQTVGEPGNNWHIDSYNSHRLGKLDLTKPGYYDIELEIDPPDNQHVDFQWIWVGK